MVNWLTGPEGKTGPEIADSVNRELPTRRAAQWLFSPVPLAAAWVGVISRDQSWYRSPAALYAVRPVWWGGV